MSIFAIELDDRALSMARNGRLLSSAPSTVFDSTADGPLAGTSAWRQLRLRPMSTSSRHLGAVLTQRGSSARAENLIAAELRTRLAEQPHGNQMDEPPGTQAGERVWIVVPARAEPKGLEAVLGIAQRLQLPVDGFVDAATMTVASLGLERNAIVLELGLHHAAATAVSCEAAQARRMRTLLTDKGGYLELHQLWLDLISRTMVKRTRFDPLHDAATEQQLFDALPILTREAEAGGNTTAVVAKGKEQFDVTLAQDQFARAAEPIYRAITTLLHQLRPAGAAVTIVVPGMVVALPGMRQLLEQFVGGELVSIPDGYAATATSLLDLPDGAPERASGLRTAAEGVRLLRRLPRAAQTIVDGVLREELGRHRSGAPPPSHVLLEGRAYSITAEGLVVGRAPGPPNTHYVSLPDGLAGVSRRHCTFVSDGDELVLLDHSTFGTFVNGERVQERVRVHAGDRIRLGEPGVELALIAVGEVNGITQQS